MKLIWVLFVACVTTNVTDAQSLVLERDIIENDVLIASTPLSYEINTKESVRLYPNIYRRNNNFMINLKPTKKTGRQSMEVEKYRKPFMKKMLIKDKHNKDVKVTIEVTTRKSLMQRTIFTIKPSDSFTKTIQKKNNGKSRSVRNFGKTKSEPNIRKRQLRSGSKKKSLDEESQDFNRHSITKHSTTNQQDFVDVEKQNMRNKNNILKKSRTLLLLSKRNNTNHFKINAFNVSAENKIFSDEVKDPNSNLKAMEDKENTTTPEVLVTSDFKNKLQEVIKSKENLTDQVKKDEEAETKDFNKEGQSTKNHDVVDLETPNISNNRSDLGKSKTFLLFPKINNTNHFKGNATQEILENKASSNDVNDQIQNNQNIGDKENSTIILEELISSDPKTKLEEVIEPKENFTDQGKKNEEMESQDFNNGGVSANYRDFDDLKAQNINHNHNGPTKSNTIILFPKRNNTNHLKDNTLEVSSEKKISSDKVNDQNLHKTVLEDKEVSKVSPEVFINSDSKNKLEEEIENKENYIDQEKKNTKEERQGFSKDGLYTDHHDLVDFETQNISNENSGLRKPNTLLLFQKRNTANNLKGNTLEVSSEDKMSSNEVNAQNLNFKNIEDADITTIIPEEFNKFDSENKLEEVIEPKENFNDQEKKDEEEFIYLKKSNQRAISNAKPVSDKSERAIRQRFRYYSFMKNKLS